MPSCSITISSWNAWKKTGGLQAGHPPGELQPLWLIHGGAIYTLADNATGARRPTATGGITSHRPARSTSCATRPQGRCGPLLGSGHRGKSTVLTAVDITGEGGRLLATGEFTFFCVDKALMDQKAGAEQK